MDSKPIILKNHWSFWENYKSQTYNKSTQSHHGDFLSNNKCIIKSNDLRVISQFLNKSVFSKPADVFNNKEGRPKIFKAPNETNLQIECFGIFKDDIQPAWEDPKNATGSEIQIKIDLDNKQSDESFESATQYINNLWVNLIAFFLAEEHELLGKITGIRIADKTNFKYSQNVCYRFEFWTELINDLNTPEETKQQFNKFVEVVKVKFNELTKDVPSNSIKVHEILYKTHVSTPKK